MALDDQQLTINTFVVFSCQTASLRFVCECVLCVMQIEMAQSCCTYNDQDDADDNDVARQLRMI